VQSVQQGGDLWQQAGGRELVAAATDNAEASSNGAFSINVVNSTTELASDPYYASGYASDWWACFLLPALLSSKQVDMFSTTLVCNYESALGCPTFLPNKLQACVCYWSRGSSDGVTAANHCTGMEQQQQQQQQWWWQTCRVVYQGKWNLCDNLWCAAAQVYKAVVLAADRDIACWLTSMCTALQLPLALPPFNSPTSAWVALLAACKLHQELKAKHNVCTHTAVVAP
jgi:hypothetical protein